MWLRDDISIKTLKQNGLLELGLQNLNFIKKINIEISEYEYILRLFTDFRRNDGAFLEVDIEPKYYSDEDYKKENLLFEITCEYDSEYMTGICDWYGESKIVIETMKYFKKNKGDCFYEITKVKEEDLKSEVYKFCIFILELDRLYFEYKSKKEEENDI